MNTRNNFSHPQAIKHMHIETLNNLDKHICTCSSKHTRYSTFETIESHKHQDNTKSMPYALECAEKVSFLRPRPEVGEALRMHLGMHCDSGTP